MAARRLRIMSRPCLIYAKTPRSCRSLTPLPRNRDLSASLSAERPVVSSLVESLRRRRCVSSEHRLDCRRESDAPAQPTRAERSGTYVATTASRRSSHGMSERLDFGCVASVASSSAAAQSTERRTSADRRSTSVTYRRTCDPADILRNAAKSQHDNRYPDPSSTIVFVGSRHVVTGNTKSIDFPHGTPMAVLLIIIPADS
jgi:hypothetical protein